MCDRRRVGGWIAHRWRAAASPGAHGATQPNPAINSREPLAIARRVALVAVAVCEKHDDPRRPSPDRISQQCRLVTIRASPSPLARRTSRSRDSRNRESSLFSCSVASGLSNPALQRTSAAPRSGNRRSRSRAGSPRATPATARSWRRRSPLTARPFGGHAGRIAPDHERPLLAPTREQTSTNALASIGVLFPREVKNTATTSTGNVYP